MKPRIKWMILVVIWLVVWMAGPLGAQEKQIKIGLLAPLTGPMPDWGRKQVVGLNMAVETINQRGGILGTPLEVVVRDSGGNGDRAAATYRELVSTSKVLAVIGPLYSSEFASVSSLTNALKVAIIATASAKPGLSDLSKRPYAFRMTVTSDNKEAPSVKAWATAHKVKTVVLVHANDDPYCKSVAGNVWPGIMGDLEVDILNLKDPVSFPTGHVDFDMQVKKIAAYAPDGICIAAFPEEAGRLIKAIREKGFTQPILGAANTANLKIIDIAGSSAEGLWSTSLFYPQDPNPKVQAYIAEFREQCARLYPDKNCEPEQYDLVVYDILHFLADIMKKKNISGLPQQLQAERDKIRSGLGDMRVWRGTTGMMSFDTKGDGIRTVHILKIEKGKWRKAF